MTLLFQYGSNMSRARLNGPDRLAGDAEVIGVAKTVERFEFEFSVWSEGNGCAAANMALGAAGREIYGVLYEVPNCLISRESAQARNRRSMDAIEGEGTNYVRRAIEVQRSDGAKVLAVTYVVKERTSGIQTSMSYVQHILDGLKENHMPEEYVRYVVAQVLANNCALAEAISRKAEGP